MTCGAANSFPWFVHMDSLLDVQVNELVAFQLTVDGVRNLHGRM